MSAPSNGLIRYWAAAREAAGTAQEPFEAVTLADALAGAVRRHGAELARVLARCSFVIDGNPVGSRAHASVLLDDHVTIEVLPPFAGGSLAAASDASAFGTRMFTRVFVSRVRGAASAVAGAALLLLASWAGRPVLGAASALLQAILVIGWFRWSRLRTPGQFAGGFVALLAAIAADVALLNEVDDANIRPLTVVFGALVVAAFLVQLGRRDGRDRLTDALAATLAAGGLCLTMASLLGVRGAVHGGGVVALALIAVGVGLLPIGARLPLPVSLPLGLALGMAAGGFVGHAIRGIGGGAGLVLASVADVLALAAATLVTMSKAGVPDAAEAVSQPSPDDEHDGGSAVKAGLRSLAATVPVAVVGPAVLVIARIMVS